MEEMEEKAGKGDGTDPGPNVDGVGHQTKI